MASSPHTVALLHLHGRLEIPISDRIDEEETMARKRERSEDSIKSLLLLLFSAIKSDGNASNRRRWLVAVAVFGRHQNPFREPLKRRRPMETLQRSASGREMHFLSNLILQWNAAFMIGRQNESLGKCRATPTADA